MILRTCSGKSGWEGGSFVLEIQVGGGSRVSGDPGGRGCPHLGGGLCVDFF